MTRRRPPGFADAVHRAAGLRLQIVSHVLLNLVALVRVIVIDGQGRRASEPKNFPLLIFIAGTNGMNTFLS
jgi:hypothetical protein